MTFTMTSLMNIALFCVALLYNFTSPQPFQQSQEANQYCSDQHSFCAKYPSSILPFRAPLAQGDGIILTSNDGFAEVTIGAFPKAIDATTKSVFLSSAREKPGAGSEPKIVGSIFGEDYYECFFMVGHHYYFHRSYHFEDHFVRVEIKVPLNMPDRMAILRGQISLDFQAAETQEDIKMNGRELGVIEKLNK